LQNAFWWKFWPKTLTPILRACGNLGARLARLSDSLGNSNAIRMALLLTVETQQRPPELLLQSARRVHMQEYTDPFLAYRQAAKRFEDYDPIQQMLLTDLTVQLPSQFLTKVDRATMAASIESRVPMLDENVARIAVNLPTKWKVNGIEKKIVLRRSQRGRLPNDILGGPKTGFGVPYKEWLRTTLYESTRDRLLDNRFIDHFSLNKPLIDSMLSHHKNGKLDAGFTLWKLLQLELFLETRS